ncbi:MAG: amidohydrolase family protein, partial [Bacteroidota bacterium]
KTLFQNQLKRKTLETIKIDAHQHFWYYDPQKHDWIDDSMSIIQKDFLPKDLEAVFLKNGIDGCISVQADQTEGETEFLLALAEEYDFIKGVVGWVDLRAQNLEERLAYFSHYPKLKGFRHVVQSEPDPKFMLQKSFQYGLGCLERYGYTYDILVFPTQLEAALETAKNFPRQKFVIDHLAKPYIKKGELGDWANYMQQLGELPNVWCKVSGMVTEADWDNWHLADFAPFLEVIFGVFAMDRLMYGSDWPVCLLGGNYSKIKDIVEQYTAYFSPVAKKRFWGENALNFYNV